MTYRKQSGKAPIRWMATGAAVLGFAALSVAAPVPASAVSAAPAPAAVLELAIHYEGNAEVAPNTATLTCDPAGGTHPAAGEACEALAQVEGDFTALPDSGGACPMVYRPVTFTAHGTWHGEPVRFNQDYTNKCLGHRATAGVFNGF